MVIGFEAVPWRSMMFSPPNEYVPSRMYRVSPGPSFLIDV